MTIKYKILSILLILISLFCQNGLVFAKSPGTTSANFLKIPVGPRAAGMGEAFVGVCDDINSIYWNPAGLRSVDDEELSFLHTKWLDDTSYQYFLGALPVKSRNWPDQTIGFSINSFNYGQIQGATYQGVKTDNIEANDLAFTLTDSMFLEGMPVIDNMYLGMSLKYITETLHDKQASAFAGDLGVLHKRCLGEGNLGFGLCIKNIGTGLKFVSESYSLPVNIAFGTSYKRNLIGLEDPLTIGLDVNCPQDNDLYFNVGAEYWVINLVGVRCGYKTGQDTGSGLRAGLGLRINIFQFDFAYGNFDQLGQTFHIGIIARFGKPFKIRMTSTPPNLDEISRLLKYANSLYNKERYAEAMLQYIKVLELDENNREALDMMKRCNEKLQEGR